MSLRALVTRLLGLLRRERGRIWKDGEEVLEWLWMKLPALGLSGKRVGVGVGIVRS